MSTEGTNVKSKPFELLFPQDRIEEKIRDLRQKLSDDDSDKRPVVLGVLKGRFVFMADLVRSIDFPSEVEFMSAHSYNGGTEPGQLKLSGGSDVSLKGRHVLLVEGVVDTGITAKSIVESLEKMEPASVEIVTLLNKTGRRKTNLFVKYIGFEIRDDFVIGYGMDHGQMYRNLPFIGKVVE